MNKQEIKRMRDKNRERLEVLHETIAELEAEVYNLQTEQDELYVLLMREEETK